MPLSMATGPSTNQAFRISCYKFLGVYESELPVVPSHVLGWQRQASSSVLGVTTDSRPPPRGAWVPIGLLLPEGFEYNSLFLNFQGLVMRASL